MRANAKDFEEAGGAGAGTVAVAVAGAEAVVVAVAVAVAADNFCFRPEPPVIPPELAMSCR